MKKSVVATIGILFLFLPAIVLAGSKETKAQCGEGRAAAQRGSWAEAEFRFEQCANLFGEPGTRKEREHASAIFSDLSVAREALGDTEGAEVAHAKALELWPENGCAAKNAGKSGDCDVESMKFDVAKAARLEGVSEVHILPFELSTPGAPEVPGDDDIEKNFREYPGRILRREGLVATDEVVRPEGVRGVILSGSYSFAERTEEVGMVQVAPGSTTLVMKVVAWAEATLRLQVEDGVTGKVLFSGSFNATRDYPGAMPPKRYRERFFLVLGDYFDRQLVGLFRPTTETVKRSLSP